MEKDKVLRKVSVKDRLPDDVIECFITTKSGYINTGWYFPFDINNYKAGNWYSSITKKVIKAPEYWYEEVSLEELLQKQWIPIVDADLLPKNGKEFLVKNNNQGSTLQLIYWDLIHNRWLNKGNVVFRSSLETNCKYMIVDEKTILNTKLKID